MSHTSAKVELLSSTELVSRHLIERDLSIASADYMLGTLSTKILDLLHFYVRDVAMHEANLLPRYVAQVLNHHSAYPKDLRALVRTDEDSSQVLLFTHQSTPDAGWIPVLYDHMKMYPLYIDDILSEMDTRILTDFGMYVVDEGHQEQTITNLQEYKLPNRVYRHYKKMLSSDLNITVKPTGDFVELFLDGRKSPVPSTLGVGAMAYVHSCLHFSNTLPNVDGKLEALECLFDWHTSLSSQAEHFYMLGLSGLAEYHTIYLNDKTPIGFVHLSIRDDKCYWVNTHLVRNPAFLSKLTYNLNDAILCILIELCKDRGLNEFNLGVAREDFKYKEFYKPETVWRKGLRYINLGFNC